MKRALTDLVADTNEKAYVYLDSIELAQQFMQQAEEEGFTFGDGVKPTARDASDFICVNADHTINYIGSIGRIAFGCGAARIGDKRLLRVDYRKYVEGEKQFCL